MFSSKFPISFILPIYNVESYLSEAIESILYQQIEKEIILVDDGSTDNSFNIALEYSRRYSFITLIHSSNLGVSAARNKGLSIARGEYVIFLDADDLFDKNANLANAYRLAKQHQVKIVKGQYISYSVLSSDQIFYNPSIYPTVKGDQASLADMSAFFQQALSVNWFIQIGTMLIEREFLIKNNITFNEELNYSEEGLFYIDMFSIEGKILEISDRFVHYRIRPNSAMSSPMTEKRLQSQQKTIQFIEQRIQNCQNETLRPTLEFVLGMYCFFLHSEIMKLQGSELGMKYQYAITPAQIEHYKSYNIGFREFQ